ncbi:MAG: hypothetical protein Q7S52_02005 [bacterium]|nr:hypothetical protein [bacterium]
MKKYYVNTMADVAEIVRMRRSQTNAEWTQIDAEGSTGSFIDTTIQGGTLGTTLENTRWNLEESIPKVPPCIFKLHLVLGVFFGFLLFSPFNLHAAEITLIATPSVAALGEEVAIAVVVDTEGKVITALSGKLTVTEEGGSPAPIERVRDGDSIIGAWLLQAKADTLGKVSFSGIIPGGVTTAQGKVLTLYLVPKKTGTIIATFSGEVFFGTSPGEAVTLLPERMELSVHASSEDAAPYVPGDETPPEGVRGIIAQNEGMFDGKPFIIVYAKDTESGILMYELLESREFHPLLGPARGGDSVLPWRRIENPAALFYPVNTRYIYVRATDREGNSAVAFVGGPGQLLELSPEKTAVPFKTWLILAILIVVAGTSCLWLWARRRIRR